MNTIRIKTEMLDAKYHHHKNGDCQACTAGTCKRQHMRAKYVPKGKTYFDKIANAVNVIDILTDGDYTVFTY